MTAEVAILNKLGVALAADSAVSIGSRKTYNSAEKLFTLSKYRPVGVMIYGNAEFMGVPWEVLIKQFRLELKTLGYSTLHEYTAALIEFLRTTLLVSSAQEHAWFQQMTMSLLRTIKTVFEDRIKQRLETQTQLTEEEVSATFRDLVEEARKTAERSPLLGHVPDGFVVQFRSDKEAFIDASIDKVFERLPIDQQTRGTLHSLIVGLVCRDDFSPSRTGVVVAGFGESDTFPAIESHLLDGRIGGFVKVRREDGKSSAVSPENAAIITPFAQEDMVATFMEGIDPSLEGFLQQTVSAVFATLAPAIVDALQLAHDRAENEGRLHEALRRMKDELFQRLNWFKRTKNIQPVLDMVEVLPKDELAAMAEALVSLTSFKRRITPDMESVGGPVDVAFISKADGFIWIKRKHYFKSELNHHFFKNYFLPLERSNEPR